MIFYMYYVSEQIDRQAATIGAFVYNVSEHVMLLIMPLLLSSWYDNLLYPFGDVVLARVPLAADLDMAQSVSLEASPAPKDSIIGIIAFSRQDFSSPADLLGSITSPQG